MNFDQLKELKSKIFNVISTKEITFLKDLDNRIIINKNGKFSFYKCLELNIDNIWGFLQGLEDNKVYSLFPLVSANNNPDEPYILLSQSILITKMSNPLLIARFIQDKYIQATELYNIPESTQFSIIFKYKAIEITFNSKNNFI